MEADLAAELVAMAEDDLAAQAPLAELYERDPRFAAWVERAVISTGLPLTLANWEEGDPPPELAAVNQLADRHARRLAEIVDRHGWPGRGLVGEDGADAAWVLAQHADRHQQIRRGWLELVKAAVADGEADPRHLSRLADRVASVDGRPQPYGTYATLGEDGDIQWETPPDGALADVDARRAAIGLPPLELDLAEPADAAPYRSMRTTPAFAWPRRRR